MALMKRCGTVCAPKCSPARRRYGSACSPAVAPEHDHWSSPIVTFADGYDAVGNRTGRNYNGVITTWVYDDAYRLTGQLQSGQRATFVYNGSGNITLKHHEGSSPMSMTFDAANRLVTTQQGSTLGTYTHDANGNMTGEQVGSFRITFVYDQENRQLQEIRSSGSRYTYTYEPDGLRRSAFHAGTADVVTFIWDGDDLLNDYIGGGVSVRYDVLNGEAFGQKSGANRYLCVPDPFGSVNHLLDTSQTIAGTYTYWPYGEVQSHTGNDTPLQFVGGLGYHTGVVNRTYVRARWYRPDLGSGASLAERSEAAVAKSSRPICNSDGSIGGVSRADPAYRCYGEACGLCLACRARIDKDANYLCADTATGPYAWARCGRTNRWAPDCGPSSPHYSECAGDAGNRAGEWGRRHNLTICCVECQIRVCCFITQPAHDELEHRLAKHFHTCAAHPAWRPYDPCATPPLVSIHDRIRILL